MNQFHGINLAWSEIESTMRELTRVPLDDTWYATWSRCLYRFSDLVIQAMWDYERNVEVVETRERYQYIQKTLRREMNILDRSLVVRSSEFETEDPTLQRIVDQHKQEVGVVSSRIVDLETEERVLSTTYKQLEGDVSIWDGSEELSLRAAQARLGKLTNMNERRELWVRIQEALFELSADADVLIGKLLVLRAEIAESAGCSNYLEYVRQKTKRPFDVESTRRVVDYIDSEIAPIFREVVQPGVVPDGTSKLRPWMYSMDIEQSARPEWSELDYQSVAISVFERVHPLFGECLKRIRDAGHMDLMARPKKSNRNFSTLLGQTDEPLIFTNLNGDIKDLRVLFHECGHALHYYFSKGNGRGLYFERVPGQVVMELVAYAFQAIAIEELDRSGELQGAEIRELRQYAARHALQTIMRGNKLEKIQHWLYSRPNAERIEVSEIDEYWLKLNSESRADWEGFEHFFRKRWQGGHFIRYPLNNMTYSIALLSMPLVTDAFRSDPHAVITVLQNILSEGNSCNIDDALTMLGITFPFTQADVIRAGAIWKAELQQ